MTFGEKLVYYRNQKGMTQKALAEAMGITPTRLNYWEKGKREPDVEMIRLLAEALDVSANVLIGFEAKEKASASEEAEARESEIAEIEAQLSGLLTSIGINPDDLTVDQADFLIHIVALIKSYFKK